MKIENVYVVVNKNNASHIEEDTVFLDYDTAEMLAVQKGIGIYEAIPLNEAIEKIKQSFRDLICRSE